MVRRPRDIQAEIQGDDHVERTQGVAGDKGTSAREHADVEVGKIECQQGE